MSEKREEKPFWLHAFQDPLAGVRCVGACMSLCDVNGDGDYKLIIADAHQRMKVFGGTCLVADNKLSTLPTAVASYYLDYTEEIRRPCVAVASGPYIFVFKNLRPFYKYKLPVIPADQKESEAWTNIKAALAAIAESNVDEGHKKFAVAVGALEEARATTRLTQSSIELLSITELEERQAFAKNVRTPLEQMTVVTCICVLKKDTDESTSIGCLVVGTENSRVIILEPTRTAPLKNFDLPSVPVHIVTAGLLDVEYRILVACRNGNIYSIKNGELVGLTAEVGSQIVGMCRMENLIAVGTMSQCMAFYQLKGKKSGNIQFPSGITEMCSLYHEAQRVAKAVIVALANGELRVYVGKVLLNTLQLPDVVTGMTFGRYGRDDATLILALRNGSIVIKMLPRKVSLEVSKSVGQGAPVEQDIPIKVPKRTELYVQQTQREREFGVDMHRMFQRDLCKLRLRTARAFVKVLTDGKGQLSFSAASSLRLTATVQGLGPLFRVRLNVQNTGTKVLRGLFIAVTYNMKMYRLPKAYLSVPALIPPIVYNFELPVECINENGGSDSVRVSISTPASAIPVVSAVVNMPVAETLAVQ